MRLKWVAAFVVAALVVFVSGVLAYPYLVRWLAPDQEAILVQACRTNKAYSYSAAECACTYHAYVKLGSSPYADLLKSSVHDTPAAFRVNVGTLAVRKVTEAGIGIDLVELNFSGSGAKGAAGVKVGLDVLAAYLRKHKYKLLARVSGFGAALAAWWGVVVISAEVVHAKYTVDTHCGGVLATASSILGQAWETTTDTAAWTWKAAISRAGL